MTVAVQLTQVLVILGACGWSIRQAVPGIRARSERITPPTLVRAVGRTSILLLVALISDSAAGLIGGQGNGDPVGRLALSDAFQLASYPFLIAAALSLPSLPGRRVPRTRMVVDGLLIMAAAATFSWFFVLGPTAARSWHSTFQLTVNILYPALDLACVAAVLLIVWRSGGAAEAWQRCLALGMGAVIVADSIWQHQALSSSTELGAIAQVIHLLAIVLIAATAGGLVRPSPAVRARTISGAGFCGIQPSRDTDAHLDQAPHVWDSLLPYALVPASAALALYAWVYHLNPTVLQGVVAGGTMLAGLAFVRQLLAIQENIRLYRRANEAYLKSRSQAEKMRTLNEELKSARDKLQSNYEALSSANLRLRFQATTDPLTGLPNHRSMVLALEQELERAGRYGGACSLLFLDLDHFKALNDSCGHLAGDSVLTEMVAPILDGLRSADVAGRWGGEEFVVILPETEVADAVIAAQRIREAVAAHLFSIGGGARLTCSIGVATYPFDAGSPEALIEAADRAMYAAKRLGRNQVRTAVDPAVVGFISEVRKAGSREEVSLWGMVEALTMIVRAHDHAADRHSQLVADLSMRVAGALGLTASEVRTVGLAARLHDLGKVSIPHSILEKSTKLDSEEWSLIAAHPAVGADVVARVPALVMLAPIIRSHHERWDGGGYPDELRGDEIPMGSRIIAVCDAFSAMTAERAYGPVRDTGGALDEVELCAGTQFDHAVVAALRHVVLEDLSRVQKVAV